MRFSTPRNLHLWLGGYLRQRAAASVELRRSGLQHLLFALCDHYEPLHGGAPLEVGHKRVQAWVERYPQLFCRFRDSDGHPPRHSFFFPGEQYDPQLIEPLGALVRGGLGEIELHLHHDGDDERRLRERLHRHVRELAQHGHFARGADGLPRYAFIHGNWCLANARRDGRWCGVDGELPLLFETGCYADFTFPAAPDESQPRIVNQIYWPTGDLARRRAYEQGERATVGRSLDDRLLIIQGPLALAARLHRVPLRVENGHLAGGDPPTAARVRSWVAQGIHIAGRPQWVFVKVCIHGAPENNAAMLLGEGGEALHRILTERYDDGRRWRLHYVTAREMYNIARAAMAGEQGDPGAFRDYALPPPPAAGA